MQGGDGRRPLAGRVAVVTGGSRGIGRAIALRLAGDGAAVVVGYHSRRAQAEAVVAEISAAGGRAVAIGGDVASPAGAGAVVQAAVERFGHLDALVHNAGIALYKLLADTEEAEWDRVVAVHLKGAYLCARAALPHLLRRGGGRIVNLASIWGQVGAANEVAYSAAKAGVIGFTKALARELARSGITVNAVSPGAVATEMIGHLEAAERDELAAATPAGRLGQPEEVAAVVAFLLRDEARYVTGQVIGVNGGSIG